MKRTGKIFLKVMSMILVLTISVAEVDIQTLAAGSNSMDEEKVYITDFQTPYVDVDPEPKGENSVSDNGSDNQDQDDESSVSDNQNLDQSNEESNKENLVNSEKLFTEELIERETDIQIQKLEAALLRSGDITPVSRGQWLEGLLNKFDLKINTNLYADEYFPDITSKSAYYDTVMTAVVFGLVDIQEGDNFNADSVCTREYAVHTLNELLGFTSSAENYTFSEADTVKYPMDIQVAVEKGWFVLSGNSFQPDTAITVADRDALLNYAYEVTHQFDDLEEDTYAFLDVVINLDELGIQYEITGLDENNNYIFTLSNIPDNVSFERGDIFGFVESGIPLAKRITEVRSSGTEYVVVTESPEMEEAFQILDLSGTNSVALNSIMSFDDSMELSYVVGGTEENKWEDGIHLDNVEASEGQNISAVEINQYYDLSKNEKIEDWKRDLIKGKYLKVTVIFSDLELDYQFKSGIIARVAVSGKMTIRYNVKVDLIDIFGATPKIPLGVISLGALGLIELDVELSVEANFSVTQVENFIIGVEVTRASGVRFIKNMYKDADPKVETQLKMTAGLKLAWTLDYMKVLSGSLYAKCGVGAKYDKCQYGDDKTPLVCENVRVWTYFQTGWSVTCKLGVDTISKKGNFVDYNELNSPMRANYHYEDGAWVEQCTRAVDWKEQKGSSIKYYTGKMSKFGSNGAGSYNGTSIQTYTYVELSDGTIAITGYNTGSSTIDIPEMIDGKTVTQVGRGSCIVPSANLKKVRTIFIPDTVTTISREAFAGCSSLVSVVFSNNLKSIGDRAFEKCSSLKRVDLPEGLKTLGSSSGSVFEGCTSLAKVYIPSSLTTVYGIDNYTNGIFAGCPLDNEGITFGENTTKILRYLFANSNITHIVIPDTVTEIDYKAFYSCDYLKKVEFSDNVRIIGDSAFSKCIELKDLQLPLQLQKIKAYAFEQCTSITEVILPPNLTTLGDNGFGKVFNNCSSLSKVFIPKSLTYANGLDNDTDGNFAGCPLDAEGITFEEGITIIPARLFMNSNITHMEIPETVTGIGTAAFRSCDNLKSIKLPERLKTLGADVFYNCKNLTDVMVPDSVTTMGREIFSGCTYLSNFPISENSSLVEIPIQAFKNTQNIKEVSIPKNIKKISDSAFENSYIEKVKISSEVNTICRYAFANCGNLETIDMTEANKLATIETYAFSLCAKLQKAVLPSSVAFCGRGAFEGCTALEEIELSTGLKEIESFLFSGCTKITSVVIPYRVKKIGASAFQNCSSLASIFIPMAVTSIETNAFSYKSMIIKGVGESYAETFANINGYPFEEKSVEVTNIVLPKQKIKMKLGDIISVEVIIKPADFTDAVAWYLEDDKSNVVKITDSTNGVIKANAVGNATVIVEADSGVKAELMVEVVQPVTSISITQSTIKLAGGEELQLKATVSPKDARNKEVKWTVQDKSIATISESGVLTGIKKGTTKVRATACDNEAIYAEKVVTVTSTVYQVSAVEELQSKHKYDNNTDETWVYKIEGANGLDVTFDEQTTIHKTDYLLIMNGKNVQIGKYTNKDLQNKTVYVKGDTVKIRLVSDAALNAWGFAVNSVEPHITRYVITYQLNGGNNAVTNPEMVVTGTELSLADPVRKGYEFAGWYTDAKLSRTYVNGTRVTAPLTLYAKWKPITYKIIYDMNDAQSEGEPAVNAPDNPTEYTIESPDIFLLTPSRQGYHFLGWYLENNERKDSISTGSIGNVVVFAKWIKLPDAEVVKGVMYDQEQIPKTLSNDASVITIYEPVSVELSTGTGGATIYYTTDGSVPSSTSSLYKEPIKVSADTVLTARTVCSGYADSEISTWRFVIAEERGYLGDVLEEDLQTVFGGNITLIPHDIWIAGYDAEPQYQGTNIVFPNFRVYDYKTLLTVGKDYTITYKNNKNAYMYTEDDADFNSKQAPQIIITGKGDYSGKVIEYFKIRPLDISGDTEGISAYVAPITLAYSPKKGQKPIPVVEYGTKTLMKGTEYTYRYIDAGGNEVPEVKAVGNYTLVVMGTGNYIGKIEANIAVISLEQEQKKIFDKVTVSTLPAQEYKEGGFSVRDVEKIFSDLDNKVTVRDGKTELIIGRDYRIESLFNAELPGRATIVLGATSESGYVGVKKVTFNIKGVSIAKAKFSLEKTTYVYSGKDNQPAVTITYKPSKNEREVLLVPTKDYSVEYTHNVSAGKATVTVTGKGGYIGSKKLTYKIVPRDIMQDLYTNDISIQGMEESYSYEKGGVRPTPDVVYCYMDAESNIVKKTLELGKDYTISYKNNTKLAAISETNSKGGDIAPKVIVTLKGNFKGKMEQRFAIEQQNIAKTTLVLTDKIYVEKALAWKSSINIVDINGKKLAKSDYDVNSLRYTYSYDTANVKRIKGTWVNRSAGEVVDKNDVPPIGTYITVSVEGKGAYTGVLSGRYRIVAAEKDISKAKATLINSETGKAVFYYTGKEIRPTKSDIQIYFVVEKEKIYLNESDYTIISYSNNLKRGTASVTIKGCGDYGGTKTITYAITTRSIWNNWFKRMIC